MMPAIILIRSLFRILILHQQMIQQHSAYKQLLPISSSHTLSSQLQFRARSETIFGYLSIDLSCSQTIIIAKSCTNTSKCLFTNKLKKQIKSILIFHTSQPNLVIKAFDHHSKEVSDKSATYLYLGFRQYIICMMAVESNNVCSIPIAINQYGWD